MGYPYEDCRRLRKNNLPQISYINKMGQPDSYNYPCAAGIPATLALNAQKYLKTRLKTKRIGNRRLDHGFAGGTMLYKNLKKLHNTGNETRPIGTNALQFGPHIFNRYNIPCAWTILCHNIWTAFSGRRKADVYRDCGLEGLIFEENNSPINFREHPLLFLLDFVDTIDPIKRFDHNMCEDIVISSTDTEMSLAFSCKVDCNAECNCWSRIREIQKISDDLAFLKSPQFETRMSGAQITFSFNNIRPP